MGYILGKDNIKYFPIALEMRTFAGRLAAGPTCEFRKNVK